MSTNAIKRIPWIDISRGLAFMVVIYSHLPQCDDSVIRLFSPMFLTTFFFVSGYLFKSGKRFSTVFEQRMRTLLVPFLVLGILLALMKQVMTFQEKTNLWDDILNLVLQRDGSLWFLAALFVYSIFFYFVDRLCRTGLQLMAVALVLYVANCISYYMFHFDLPWHLGTMGFGCFYMALGKLYKMYEADIDRRINGWMLAVAAVLYVAYIVVTEKYITCGGSLMMIDAMVITLIGLALTITISKKYLNNSRLLLFVGANSLFYFAAHGKVYSMLGALGNRIAPDVFGTEDFFLKLVIGIGITLVDAIILIPPTIAVNKWVPQILGKNFKFWN